MSNRKHSANENFFETIDTEEKAYWLGFIYADGSVLIHKNTGSMTLEIGLQIKDINHLEKFKEDIKATNPVKVTNNGKGCRISIHSRKLVKDLMKHGIVPNKSLIAIPPGKESVPEALTHHFIRGIFDGDGGFTIDRGSTYAVCFCGTVETCEYVLNFFSKQIRIDKKKGSANFGQFKIKGNLQAREVSDILYKDCKVYLERKYNVYLNLISKNKQQQLKREANKKEFLGKQEQMVALLKQGLTGVQVAKVMDCGATNVTRYVKEHKNAERDQKRQLVLNLYNSGIENKSEIHRVTGFSRDYIRKVLSE